MWKYVVKWAGSLNRDLTVLSYMSWVKGWNFTTANKSNKIKDFTKTLPSVNALYMYLKVLACRYSWLNWSWSTSVFACGWSSERWTAFGWQLWLSCWCLILSTDSCWSPLRFRIDKFCSHGPSSAIHLVQDSSKPLLFYNLSLSDLTNFLLLLSAKLWILNWVTR